MTYQEQLQSERWKEKRKSILRRDDFKCQSCSNLHPLRSFEISRLGIKPIKNGILLTSGKIEYGNYKRLVCKSNLSLIESFKKYKRKNFIPIILFQVKEKSDFFNHIGTFLIDSKHYKFKKLSSNDGLLGLFIDPKLIVEYEKKLKSEIMDLLYT